MSALLRHCLRAATMVVAGVAALGIGGGLVRLLPWLLAPEVPLPVAWPFARALGARALEIAVLIGLPVGFGLGAAAFVERGEARALLALGASPARLAGGLVLPTGLAVLLAVAAMVSWGGQGQAPGRFANELLAQGRASCTDESAPRTAEVPLVGATWHCFPGRSPRVVGRVPRIAREVWFTAEALELKDDLTGARLSDLRLASRGGDASLALRIQAGDAVLRGLPPWGRSATLGREARAALTAASGAVVGLLSVVLVLAARRPGRFRAAALSGGAALAMLAVLQTLDRGASAPLAYSAVPGVGVALAVLLGRLLPGETPRVARR